MSVHQNIENFEEENLGANYSRIIAPEDYNTLMTDQHLYIRAADNYIAKSIQTVLKNVTRPNIVEIGCGPARITKLVFNMNQKAKIYGLDVDASFLKYAQTICQDLPIQFINSSIEGYEHPCSVDLFYSEGFHHHVAKDDSLNSYLGNVFKLLKKGGYYIVGDEFIADYKTNDERETNLVLWYCHIIANALKKGFDFLAQEEAKTLLDDIYEGRIEPNIKSSDQIGLVLKFSTEIEDFLKQKKLDLAKTAARDFLNNLNGLHNKLANEDDAMNLSRGDFKISCSDFVKEVEGIGFTIDAFRSFGPASGVGCMGVYTLHKP